MRRPTVILALLGVLLLASGCPSPGPTPTPSVGYLLQSYTIVSEHSGKCLSLELPGGFYEKDPAQQWACNHYHMGLQGKWLLDPTGQIDHYRLVSTFSGKCLEAGSSDGSAVVQAKCTTAANQEWIFKFASAAAYTIASASSGKCMQVKPGTTGGKSDGDAIEVWSCSAGSKNQMWSRTEADAPNPPLDTGTGELCNVCNPQMPECKTGAMCMVMTTGQYLCGQSCSGASPCPSGYTCKQYKTSSGSTVSQCVPTGDECPR